MSNAEIIVILIGLVVGYWAVSKLLARRAAPKKENAQTHSRQNDHADNQTTAPNTPPVSWYEVLNVPPNASIDAIRRAYRTIISQYHPDKVASLGTELRALAEQKSKEINNAYNLAMRLRGAQR